MEPTVQAFPAREGKPASRFNVGSPVMYHNRVQHYFNSLAEPRPPIAGSPLGGFMLVPLGGLSLPVQHATMAQRMVYEMAFAAAMRDVWRTSLGFDWFDAAI
jgi:hypothetical protein